MSMGHTSFLNLPIISTLSDWANIGTDPPVINKTVRPAATLDDLRRLLAAIRTRYGNEPRNQADRLAAAWRIVDDIGSEAWKMRLGDVADRLADVATK